MRNEVGTALRRATRRRAAWRTAFARLSRLALIALLAAQPVGSGQAAVEGTISPVDQASISGTPENLLDILGLRGAATIREFEPVAMRDGVHLSAMIVLPLKAPETMRGFPTILVMTPYPPHLEISHYLLARTLLGQLVRRGYAVAVVNDRGTFWSEGQYRWLRGARNDGWDTLSWIAAQPWSNGRIGTYGCSSSAENQFGLLTIGHPALKAAVVIGGSTGVGVIPGFGDQGLFYTGGVPSLDWARWYEKWGYRSHPILPPGLSPDERARLARVYSPNSLYHSDDVQGGLHLPSADILRAAGFPATEFDDLIRLTPASPQWRNYDLLRTGDRARIPALHIDSWYDTNQIFATVKAYEYLSRVSADQYLVVGGGPHCQQGDETENTMIGARSIGDARFDYAGTITAWFDHWLKPEDKAPLVMPRVQYYPLDTGKWQSARQWPPRAVRPRNLYLASDGGANSRLGNGRLAWEAGAANASDTFVYDPLKPVAKLGGGVTSDAAADQSQLEERNDILVYTSAPLAGDLNLAGDIVAHLWVSSTVADTDIMLKLVDVYPDGRAFNLLDTAQRLRYRDGADHPQPMVAGRSYEIVLPGMVLAARIRKGHRLRIEITSSNFPQYERNLNTGGDNALATAPVIARTTIWHRSEQQSYLQLPIVDQE